MDSENNFLDASNLVNAANLSRSLVATSSFAFSFIIFGNELFSKLYLFFQKIITQFYKYMPFHFQKKSSFHIRRHYSCRFVKSNYKLNSICSVISAHASSSISSSRNSFLLSASVIFRITLQGLPAAMHQSGISFVTTLPAPTTTLLPIVMKT